MIESDRLLDTRYRREKKERNRLHAEGITSITSSSIRGIASLINGGILCLVSGFERCRSSILVEHLADPLSYTLYERNVSNVT